MEKRKIESPKLQGGDDKELAALDVTVKWLEQLEREAQLRVLAYLQERFGENG